MNTQVKLIKLKVGFLKLAEVLGNVSFELIQKLRKKALPYIGLLLLGKTPLVRRAGGLILFPMRFINIRNNDWERDVRKN